MTAEVVATPQAEEETARARRRWRRASATSASSLVARFASFGAFALLVPITLPYLGAERYGVWMILLSVVALIGITNLGMGAALITIIARTDAARDDTAAGRYVSTAVALFTTIALGLGVIALITFPIIPWSRVFNVAHGPLSTEAGLATTAVFIIYLLNIPAGIVTQIRQGFQEGYANAWWGIAASGVTVAAVAIAVAGGAGLVTLAAAAAIFPLAANAANWSLLVRKRPRLRPRFQNVMRNEARELVRSGGLFFVLQVAIVVGFSSDNLVAAQVLGAKAVTDYSIPSHLALGVISLITVLVSPLWPAYAEALARNDTAWAVRTLRRSLPIVAGLATLGAVVFVAAGKLIVREWSRGEVDPGWLLLIGLGLWIILGSTGNALSYFLNAAHVVRLQVVCASLMALANIILSVFLTRQIGVAGLIWGTVISYTIFVVIPFSFAVPRLLRRFELGVACRRRVNTDPPSPAEF